MARLFLSHSSANDAAALALNAWLDEQGFDDVFLDVDPLGGIAPGERWQDALRAAADRCEAVLFMLSPPWLASQWCQAEFLLAKSLHKRIFGLIVEPVALDRIPTEMTAEWQLCDLTGKEEPRSFEVSVKNRPVSVSFPVAGLALLRRGLERAGLDASSFPWPPSDDSNRAPYRGLSALEAEDAAIFFGRDAAIVRGLDSIRGMLDKGVERTLVILGASGSGKSSFLRAGLWPRLARADTSFLPLPVIRPELAAITGNSGLAASLATAFAGVGGSRTPGEIKANLAQGNDPLGTLLDELLDLAKRRLVGVDQAAAGPAIVISIDQAEELFNADGAAEAATFFDLLTHAFRSEAGLRRRLLILATMRSDSYEMLQSSQQLVDVKRALFDLPPISPSEFKSVIEGPVHVLAHAGRDFEIDPALTEQLVAESQGADALPLLAFTLERLYADFGGEGRLTLNHYDQIGRVKGAIEAAVNQALAHPERPPAIPASRDAQFAALRAAFIPWLARIDSEGGAPLRRVARLDELPEESRAVVERLIGARLLVADRRMGVDIVEVAHESLLRQWPALTVWLETDQENLKLVEGVDRAAREWNNNGRLEAWLDHRAARLASAENLASRHDFHRRLGEIGVAYLSACRAQEDAARKEREEALAREQTRLTQIAVAQKRTARLLAAVAVAVVLGIGVGLWLFQANKTLQATLEDRQVSLNRQKISLLAEVAATQRLSKNLDGALRLAIHDARLDAGNSDVQFASPARSELAAAFFQSSWRLILGGHTGGVSSVAFSPDGARIVTASYDSTARIFDAATGRQLSLFGGQEDKLTSAAFSPDGKRVVTGSRDRTARVWDIASGTAILILRSDLGVVTSAAFNDDGTLIVTSVQDGTSVVWDAATGSRRVVLLGHEGPVWKASFSHDGSRIVTASEDGSARVWDAATGHQLLVLRGHAGGVWSAAFSPDGKRIVTASYDNKAIIWDADTGAQIHVLDGHLDWVMSAEYSADGTRIVTASQDGTARLWDAESGETLATLAGHEGGVLSAVFSPDGKSIATASFDRTARLWDVRTGTPLASMQGHTDKIWSAAFSPDGKRVITASQDKSARIWDATTGQEQVRLLGHDSWVLYAAFSADGKRVVTASQDDTARIWDAESGKEITVLRGHEGGVLMAEFSSDGKRVVTASFDRTARIWDAETGKEIIALRGHQTGVLTAAFSVDGTKVVSGAYDETVRIWDAATGSQQKVMRGHTGGVWDAHFDVDGKRIVTASEDRTARIWDVASGKELLTLHGHEDWVWSALFSSDGKRIVTGSQDHTARVWNASDGVEIGVLREIEGGIFFATFSPDGERIVTASDNKVARVWNAQFAETPSKELISEVCAHRLDGVSTLTRDEMRLAGYPDSIAAIDVCAGPN